MKMHPLGIFFPLTLTITTLVFADATTGLYCDEALSPMRITLRNIEAGGIGYRHGYTTLEGFFSPLYSYESWIPFLDLRGHVFNNGRLAANAGIGIRYLSSWVWGCNIYYDYRATKQEHYNQIAIGLEALGEIVDFRVNGYLPVGTTHSGPFNAAFDMFAGNFMFVSYKKESSFKGFNAEVGAHVDYSKKVPVYFAAGPYYLTSSPDTTWGGQARVAIDLFDYCRLEGNVSYDHLFHWIGQGQISLIFPFGRKQTPKKQQCTLKKRSLQKVDRNEIIPVHRKQYTTVAIDPSTNNPYNFIFVNNNSSSLGTFESPFPTFAQAEAASLNGDILYIFPGDGSATGMNNGITLKENQMLLGSSLSYSFSTQVGNMTVPAFTTSMPFITNVGGAAITLSNNNTISGLHIDESMEGISGTGITNTIISQNQFTTPIVQDSISISDIAGTVSIFSNSFISNVLPDELSNGIVISNSNASAEILIANNFFENQGGSAIGITLGNDSQENIFIANNTMIAPIGFEGPQIGPFPGIGPGPKGVLINALNNAKATVSILNNTCKHQELAGILVLTQNNSSIDSLIQGNLIIPGILVPITGSFASFGIGCEVFDNATQNALLTKNVVTAAKSACLGFANLASPKECSITITDNIISGGGTAPGATIFGGGAVIANQSFGSPTGLVKAVVTNNSFIDNPGYGGFLALSLPVGGDPGPICLRLTHNSSNTGYSLYNASPNTGRIYLEEGYQTNVGTIDEAPLAPIPFFPDGGPINHIPVNGCQ